MTALRQADVPALLDLFLQQLTRRNLMKLFAILLLSALAIGCGYSKSTTPVQPGTMPTIAGLIPNNAIAGGTAVPFEVDGTNFAAGVFITFNGATQITTRVSATKLTTTIQPASIATAGVAPVTVTNPSIPGGPYGGGTQAATSAALNFTIN
jgi:hypothetical protein